ncbi:MAG: head GIN domain-containing protein [Flavobacteriaceae bacterium]
MKISNLTIVLVFIISVMSVNAQSEIRRTVGEYDGVRLSGHYDVVLFDGKEGEITLKGDPDDLDQVETYVKNNVLVIKEPKSSWIKNWNWSSQNVVIRVPVKDISEVTLSGSGTIDSETTLKGTSFLSVISGSGDIVLSLDYTEVEGLVSGSGDIELIGNSNKVVFKVTGSGTINASDLIAESGETYVTGSGDIKVRLKSELSSQITGSGDVICYGNPPRQKTKVVGSGNITIRN